MALTPAKPGLLLLVALLWIAQHADAQELEARAFAPNPVGARFAVASYARSAGDMLLNSSSPIEDFEIRADMLSLGFGGTFAIADRVASFAIALPLIDGTAAGRLNGVAERVDRTGLGDLRLRVGVSLLPGSAQDVASFTRAPPDRTLGASLLVVMPTGEYFEDRLVNLGSNRWAFKPELGGSRRLGRWFLDGSIALWLYQDNDEFLGGKERSQEPIGVLQGNLSYTFAPRLWLGAGATWYAGGRTEVDGVSDRNRQDNSRVGVTLAVPVGRSHSMKLACSTGVTARFGGDLDTCSLTWQYLWFD